MNKYVALAVLIAAGTLPAMANHHGHSDRFFDKMDVNNDGIVTRNESANFAARIFSNADLNKDGRLTRAELSEYKQIKHEQMSHHKHGHNLGGYEPANGVVYYNDTVRSSNPNYDSNIVNHSMDPKHYNSQRSARVYQMEKKGEDYTR